MVAVGVSSSTACRLRLQLQKRATRGVSPDPAVKKPRKDSRVETCAAHASYWLSILPLPQETFEDGLGLGLSGRRLPLPGA